LPNNTFKGNAGTEVISDILILQKRDRLIDIEPDWVHLDTDENGINAIVQDKALTKDGFVIFNFENGKLTLAQ
jgi:hypothetical protein